MAKHTTRDLMWTIAVKKTHRDDEPITSADLAEKAGVSERSARDLLKTMEFNGVIAAQKRGRKLRYVGRWEEE